MKRFDSVALDLPRVPIRSESGTSIATLTRMPTIDPKARVARLLEQIQSELDAWDPEHMREQRQHQIARARDLQRGAEEQAAHFLAEREELRMAAQCAAKALAAVGTYPMEVQAKAIIGEALDALALVGVKP